MDEEEGNNVGDDEIVKPLSAYHQYSKINSSLVKDELLREGKDTSLGVVVSIVAAKWKTLQEDEKARYEAMAKEDKIRYNRECSIRDEEVLMMQEERRKANAITATDTRMRGTTIKNSDASDVKEANKRTREISDKEREKHSMKRQAKEEVEGAIKSQLDELKASKAQQAEARLKFLLAQSDIFSHFGSVKAGGVSASSSAAASANRTGIKNSRRNVSSEDLDEDEKAMQEEELEGDEEGDGAGAAASAKHQGSVMLTKQPSCITGGAMRAYQLEGLNWMIRLQDNGINGILADEMGLGKTLQSVSVVAYMREFRDTKGPHLIMVPKSTLSNWCNEFKRWCPVVNVLRFHGTKEERAEIIQEQLKPGKTQDQRDWDVVVTTYEIVNLEKTALSKIAWKYLIIDEAHRLKNEASQFSQTVRLLNTEHRLLLTGTPLQNNLHELWALLNFLLPDVFASSEQFDDWFDLDVDDTEAKQRIIGQLHKLLRPFMLRRLKADVEKSLLPKTETILFTGMSAVQKTLYRQILLRDIDTINNSATANSNGGRTAILNIVMQLRKCCNHPYLFPGVEDRTQNPMGEHLYQSCGKMVLLDKLLAKLKQRDHRVLIFSQMTRMLDILEDYLLSQGYKYCRIDGNTTYEEREDRIYDFNKPDSDKFVFILSTRAGGLGINLQTADTVILYDSDWNPQADLQAQDRAHRIGQKKPVQVFRLVTDETVEVKVVERAQQKLKLDAMVVQQGRLQEKERKLSKQDLLDTLRFGADKIFRSKDSTISDADIDLILAEGRKRTEELNEKLQTAEKGDMYDFRLDGGMNTQTFEGVDYSNKVTREDERAALAAAALYIDVGKRERKAIATYSETIARQTIAEEGDKRQKLPRHLRLSKMEDWQFFDKVRLNELQAEEVRLFDLVVEKGEAPQSGMITKFVVLPPAQQEEKIRLIGEAFADWTRVHFNNFVRASAKHGRSEYEKIAKDVQRPLDETRRYALAFWEKGASDLPAAEWERVTKQIEKGEKRLEEISRLTTATAKLIMMFDDPWEELTFRNVGNQGRIFNAVEDRFLLCLTHLHGYGSWDQVRNSVRRCERFRFDFYLQSCSSDALGKRCELLMRSAERELLEIERKKQATDSSSSANARVKAAGDVARERMADITKQIAEESKRLAATRSALQKVKTGNATVASSSGAASSSAGNTNIKAFFDGEKGSEVKKTVTPSNGVSGRPLVNIVAEEFYPELCQLLKTAGPDGISKVVDAFLVNHPLISKRQVELKIFELAVKEKRSEDSYKIWHIRDEFTRYLDMVPGQPIPAKKNEPKSAAKSKQSASDEAPKSSSKAASTPKRKRDDEAAAPSSGAKDGSGGSAVKGEGPKKFKRAFGFFVKAKRAEAEESLGDDASKTDALRDLLTRMWEDSPPDVRKAFDKKEQEDRLRYDKELAIYEKAQAAAATAGGSSKKKAKA